MTAEPLTLFDLVDDGRERRHRRGRNEPRRPLPASVDLMTAAQLLGVGRTCAYGLVRQGRWPTPVIRVGRRIRVPTQPLLALLEPGLADIHRPPVIDDEDGFGVRD
jgi:excisionase family DNA binding protein